MPGPFTITGTLGGPFILHPPDNPDTRAVTLFVNQIVAGGFIRSTNDPSTLKHSELGVPLTTWIAELERNGITHISVNPAPTDWNLVPVSVARTLIQMAST